MQEDNKINFKTIKTLGPSILKVEIPKVVVDKLNSYVDEIIINKKKSDTLNHGDQLVGDVSQEFRLEEEIMKVSGWGNFLAICVKSWIQRETGDKITKFHIIDSWIVRQFKNEYNPTHWHSGHITGAGFLKVPKNLGKHSQKKETEYRGGSLQLIHGSRMFLCPSTFNIVPKVGDFYFFPNYMMHTVFPFKDTDEERRSISFNAEIDDKIYNVYGA